MLPVQLQAPASPRASPAPAPGVPASQTHTAEKGHVRISNQAQTLQKNRAQINNTWNLCPLLFIHYGAFVGFSLAFYEVTVSRNREKKKMEEKRKSKG